MITVMAWFWKQPGGRTTYEAAHVTIWADMVRRHLKQPHRLAVVTTEKLNLPAEIETIVPPREFEDVRLPTWAEGRPQCLRRLVMFRPDAARWFGERFVCMDLDCVIGGPLDPMFDSGHDFRMFKGTAPGRPYNGSMMLLKAGARPQVYNRFTPEGAATAGRQFVGSDQAWISHILGPNEAVWDERDGVGWWQPGAQLPLLFFPGKLKPWDVIGTDPHVGKHYRRASGGKALILGRARSVWDDAEAALDRESFDGVIAVHEAARHWPGKVDAIADDDGHALKLATMLGFGEWTFCGRTV